MRGEGIIVLRRRHLLNPFLLRTWLLKVGDSSELYPGKF
jgi:hypothetical protein